MPGKRKKNQGTIELTRDQWNVVTAQKVVESFWFANPRAGGTGRTASGLTPPWTLKSPTCTTPVFEMP